MYLTKHTQPKTKRRFSLIGDSIYPTRSESESTKRERLGRYTVMRRRMRGRAPTTRRRGKRVNRTGVRRGVGRIAKRVRALERTAEETKTITYSTSDIPASRDFHYITPGITPWNLRKNNPYCLHVNGLTRGITVRERIGDHAVWTKIRGRLAIFTGTSISSEVFVKWRLIQWYRPDGSDLTASQYFLDTYGIAEPNIHHMPNILNRNQVVRYKTLAQGTKWIRHVSDSATEETIIDIDWYSKGVRTSYVRSNNGNFTDIDRNSIYLIMWTGATATVGGMDVYGELQCRFHG